MGRPARQLGERWEGLRGTGMPWGGGSLLSPGVVLERSRFIVLSPGGVAQGFRRGMVGSSWSLPHGSQGLSMNTGCRRILVARLWSRLKACLPCAWRLVLAVGRDLCGEEGLPL